MIRDTRFHRSSSDEFIFLRGNFPSSTQRIPDLFVIMFSSIHNKWNIIDHNLNIQFVVSSRTTAHDYLSRKLLIAIWEEVM